VLAKNGVGIARALVDDSESFLHIAKARSKGGVGLQSDVERAKANLASSLSRLEEVREVWRQTSTQLATVLQADPEILLDPSDGGVAQWDLPNLSSSSELTELALSRPDIEAMRAQASASVERVKAARWDLFAPELIAEARFSGVGGRGETAEPERADVLSNAIGSVGRAANNWRNVLGGGAPISSAAGSFGRAFYDYRDVFRDNESEVGLESRFNLSVGLTWTFSFGKHSQIQERKAELERAELRVRQLENRAAGEVQAAKSAIASAAERIEQAGDELVAAEANNRIAMARFREGTAIALEVLDAQRVVAQSRLSLIRHITENNLAQTRLLAAAGILEAEAIRELRHQQ